MQNNRKTSERVGTAYLIPTPHGFMVEIDGNLHTLTRLFNVETVRELDAAEALECLQGHLGALQNV